MPVSFFDFVYSQQIVSASEYAAGGGVTGNITKIRYKLGDIGDPSMYDNWTVYLGNTTKTAFSSTSDWVPLAELTEVFSGTIVPVANGWFEIVFTTPFNYTGGNLVVAVDENSLGDSGNPQIFAYTSTANSGLTRSKDGVANNPDPANPGVGVRRSKIAQLQFEGTLASCLPPSAITTLTTTSNSATISWTAVGTAAAWDVEYGVAGFTPTGTPNVSNTTNPTTITGLAPNTTYQYYVRSVCGPSDVSVWSVAYSFTTPCIPSGIPFFEGFESGYANEVILAGCWSQQVFDFDQWKTNTFSTFGRAPRTGLFNATLATGGNTMIFHAVELVAGTPYQVKFYAKQDGNTSGSALINASFGTAANETSMTTVLVASTDLTDAYQEFTAYFTPNTTGVYYLGIKAVLNYSPTFASIDDISVELAPSCVAPSALAVSNVTGTSADLSWTENGMASDWEVEFGVAGFTPTGAPTVSVSTNPTSINSLTPSTSYQFYVRTICGTTDFSTWSGPFTFTTPCTAATIPFFEGFETGYVADAPVDGCWSQEINLYDAWEANIETDYNRTPRTGTWNATLFYGNESMMFHGIELNAGTQYLVKFYARQDGNNPGSAVISASFGLSPNEAAMTSTLVSPTDLVSGGYQEFVAYYTPATTAVYYLGIKGLIDNSPWYITLDDISVEVAPSCAAPSALTASGMTQTTVDVSWTENGTATSWDFEYGFVGFTPTGTPTVANVSTNPTTLTGLTPGSTYQVYLRSTCSLTDVSTWSGPYSFTTLCAPIATLPWTENFDNLLFIGDEIYPNCWLAEDVYDWSTSDIPASNFDAGPLSGINYLSANYFADSKIWTPEFELTAGETYEFSFNWAGDGESNWEGAVFVNDAQSSTGATMLGANFVSVGEVTTYDYKKEIYCFTPVSTGTYSFAISVLDDDWSYNLNFDDFGLKQVIATPGTDGSLTVCQLGNAVDLNTVITTTSTDGVWTFDLNQSAVNANMLTVGNIAAGTYDILYIVGGCIPDTTTATITVVGASIAGVDGAVAACRNQPLDLSTGLASNVDSGGVWTDPNGAVVPNGMTTSGNIPGQYNYKYIVSNGVCPADTAKIVVNVQGCDHLGLEDVAFDGFNLYPNPTSDVVYISNTGSTEVFNYEVLDMNGRVILKKNDAINGSTTTELDLSKVEEGVYLVRVFNQQAEKTFRVVKN